MQYSLPSENVFLDLTPRTKLRFGGADRVRFLNGQVSNDVRQATGDVSIYAGVMTIKGKLCGDVFIHQDGDYLVLDADGNLRETLAARLERYIIADDVQMDDVTDERGLFHVLEFSDEGKTALSRTLVELAPEVRPVRSRRYGRAGLDLFFDATRDIPIRERLLSAGITLLNDDALESLRILSGVPRWGADLDENTMPAEAGIEEQAVSFTKGCYIGQEVVSRIKSVGHVTRQLRGLRALDASPLYAGMVLRPMDGKPDDRAVGRITSAAPSAGHGGAAFVALGYVRREWAAPGTLLDAVIPPDPSTDSVGSTFQSAVELPPPSCQVEVCSLPFIS